MALAPAIGLFPFSNPQLALCLPQLVSESCPRLSFLKLSDCHGVTPDALIMLAKACPQLHSLDIQHSMVSPMSPGAPRKPGLRWQVPLCWVPRWSPRLW